jgi:nucleoside 2-deoxyribosyltransferase
MPAIGGDADVRHHLTYNENAMNETFKCPITGLDAERIDSVSYRLNVKNEDLFIKQSFPFTAFIHQDIFIKNKHLLAGAILTRQLFEEDKEGVNWFLLTGDFFEKKFNKIIYPKTPKSKLDNLFRTLYHLQNIDGEVVQVFEDVEKPEFYYKHFFRTPEECYYYFKELVYQDLIACTFHGNTNKPFKYRITFKGLNYYLDLTEKGDLSNICFVAMSFDSELKETREAIRKAILQNDFDPIIIDEQLIDSSQTINDAIISAIKSCKFCIADFSQQKDGVYFESGFAVGLGKPVIYTCSQDWFKKSHFDTNHFPHIIYDSNNELIEKLDTKIKAWIK